MEAFLANAEIAEKRVEIADRLLGQLEAVAITDLNSDYVGRFSEYLGKWLRTSTFKVSRTGKLILV
jgi:hypothetical protein